MPQFSLDFDLDSEHGLDAAPAEGPASIGYGIAGLEEGSGAADGQGIALVVDAEVGSPPMGGLPKCLGVGLLRTVQEEVGFHRTFDAGRWVACQWEGLIAQVTSYLMMGALSPGLKRHSVTLFEGDPT